MISILIYGALPAQVERFLIDDVVKEVGNKTSDVTLPRVSAIPNLV